MRNKAERLVVAAAVAPALRAARATVRLRPVKLYDRETGDVVGHVTLASVQEALLAAAKIELEVVDGARPKEGVCKACGALFIQPTTGNLRGVCERCAHPRCADCGEACSRASTRCRECNIRTSLKPRAACATCGEELTRAATLYIAKHPDRFPVPRCQECIRGERRKIRRAAVAAARKRIENTRREGHPNE